MLLSNMDHRIEKFANLEYVYFIEEVGLLIDQDDERWPAKDRYEFLKR